MRRPIGGGTIADAFGARAEDGFKDAFGEVFAGFADEEIWLDPCIGGECSNAVSLTAEA